MKKALLDSCVFLDFFTSKERQEKASAYLRAVSRGEMQAAVSSFTLLEVKYHVRRLLGRKKADEAIYHLLSLPNLEVISLSQEIAGIAADLRLKYYYKNKVFSFGDAIQFATAISSFCSCIITADDDFRGLEEIRAEIY